jgi:hypothetical protein
MDDEEPSRESAINALNLLCLAACGVTVIASGGLALFAGAIALASFAGSIAASLAANLQPASEWDRTQDEWQPISEAESPAIAQQPETPQPIKSWVLSLDTARQASRHR